MRSIESEGETIDQAIDKALQTLQASRDQVEVEILADAQRGMFGFGGKKARIRATMRAPLVARLTEAPPTGPGGAQDRRSPAPAEVVEVSRETARTRRAEVSRETSAAVPGAASAPSDEAVEKSRRLLVDLLSHLGSSCSVVARSGPEVGTVILDVAGDTTGLLIGRRGQTLDAIEYLINRIVGRDDSAAVARVTVDVERYRERRAEYLTGLAVRVADKVKKTGRPVALNPMSPRDRRVVHMTLQSDARVSTQSHGDGHYRKLVIAPAEHSRRVRQSPSAG
jgi:spoIIIJ-associated protein